MLASNPSRIASEAFAKGYNCCEAVLLAADSAWELQLSPDVFGAGAMFYRGIGSGCCCGALVGLVMVSGVMSQRHPHPMGKKLAPYLHRRFQEQFGSTCCRDIRAGQAPSERFRRKGCRVLTGLTAELMVEVWEGMAGGGDAHLGGDSDSE